MYTLQYVYELTDFSTTGGSIVPPAESGGTAVGDPPFSFTLNAGAQPVAVSILDNDPILNEVGDTGQLLEFPVTLNGTTYPAGTPVIVNYMLTTASGLRGYSITLGQANTGSNTTTAFVTEDPLVPGQTYVFVVESNIGTGGVPAVELACFAAGTLIDVPGGTKRVERLAVGDLVVTRDNGAQPIRWTGRRTVQASGNMAPIMIAAGTLGATEDLYVSPNHRLLIEGCLPELLVGEAEVLVAAKHLVNGRSIRQRPTGLVTYVHFMFDRHEIVRANGCAAESFLLGDRIDAMLHPDQVRELTALFPQLQDLSQGGTVRMSRPEALKREGCLFATAL